MLQGFNLHSHEGLNNILHIINDKFSTSYPLAFTAEEYATVFSAGGSGRLHSMGKSARHFDYFDILYIDSEAECRSRLAKLSTSLTEARATADGVVSYGISASVQRGNPNWTLRIQVSPDLVAKYAPAITDACNTGATTVKRLLNVRYTSSMVMAGQGWRFTSHLEGTTIKIADDRYSFMGKIFKVIAFPSAAGPNRAMIEAPLEFLADLPGLAALNDTLFDCGAFDQAEFPF